MPRLQTKRTLAGFEFSLPMVPAEPYTVNTNFQNEEPCSLVCIYILSDREREEFL